MQELQEKLIGIVRNDSGKFTSSRMTENFFHKNHAELIGEIYSATGFYSKTEINFTKRILLIVEGVCSRLTCSICSGDIDPMKRGESGVHFRQFCSSICSGKSNKGTTHIRSKEEQDTINKKRESTMIDLHGVAFNSQRLEVKQKLSSMKYQTHSTIRYDLLEDRDYLVELYKTLSSTEIGDICGCDYSVVLDYLRKYGVSIGTDHTKVSREQREIAAFVESLGFVVEMNSPILGKYDIDVFVPALNVGIEFNGFPWHLEHFTNNRRGKHYHLHKTNVAKSKNIRLIHVFPHDLNDNKEIIFSIIKNALKKSTTKIFGRNCVVRHVERTTAGQFLIDNHLKGNTNFDLAVGLYHMNTLVHVVTFGKSRYDKKYTFEVIRSASRVSTNVLGGFSKCLSFFTKYHCSIGNTIMTYADRAISEGDSYLRSGFSFVRTTTPNYHYVERVSGGFAIHSRVKFQKHKLVDLPTYNKSKTEWEIMVQSGYDRFWDCGNNMYEYVVQ